MKRAAGPDGTSQCLGRGKVDIGNPNLRACTRQFLHRGLANAARAPGNQSVPSV
jgi:hypothetical protein